MTAGARERTPGAVIDRRTVADYFGRDARGLGGSTDLRAPRGLAERAHRRVASATRGMTWLHVRHEEAAAFAAAAEAAMTGDLAVCAGSCGPGNLHLINGLFDAQPQPGPRAGHRRAHPAGRDRHQLLPGDPPAGAVPRVQRVHRVGQQPRAAARHAARSRCAAAVERRGVAVVVVPGEVFTAPTSPTLRAARRSARPRRWCDPPTPSSSRGRRGPQRRPSRDHPGRGRLRGSPRRGRRPWPGGSRRRSCTRCAARSSSSTTTLRRRA